MNYNFINLLSGFICLTEKHITRTVHQQLNKTYIKKEYKRGATKKQKNIGFCCEMLVDE